MVENIVFESLQTQALVQVQTQALVQEAFLVYTGLKTIITKIESRN